MSAQNSEHLVQLRSGLASLLAEGVLTDVEFHVILPCDPFLRHALQQKPSKLHDGTACAHAKDNYVESLIR